MSYSLYPAITTGNVGYKCASQVYSGGSTYVEKIPKFDPTSQQPSNQRVKNLSDVGRQRGVLNSLRIDEENSYVG